MEMKISTSRFILVESELICFYNCCLLPKWQKSCCFYDTINELIEWYLCALDNVISMANRVDWANQRCADLFGKKWINLFAKHFHPDEAIEMFEARELTYNNRPFDVVRYQKQIDTTPTCPFCAVQGVKKTPLQTFALVMKREHKNDSTRENTNFISDFDFSFVYWICSF